jgi:hypothetical protein
MSLTKRADPDGTFSLLNGSGKEVARGLTELDADVQVADSLGQTQPGTSDDDAGAKAGGGKGSTGKTASKK